MRCSLARRYRQFLSLHTAVSEHVKPQDMPHLPGKRILGSSVDPSFAEARGLALQVLALPALPAWLPQALPACFFTFHVLICVALLESGGAGKHQEALAL